LIKAGEVTVRGVCFEGVEKVSLRELPDPVIQAGRDAIIQVSMAGLCGSDLHPFFGRESGLDPGTVMGHELVGEVVELGPVASKMFSVGDRVFAPFSTNCGSCFYCQRGLTSRCVESQLFGWIHDGKGLNGCQAELVRVPLADSTLMKVPDGITDEQALLLGDNFSTGYFCADLAKMYAGGSCAVIGCGTVGLLSIVAAKAMGADEIFAVDMVEHRLAVAESLGATPIVAEKAYEFISQATEGRGVDAVMELVGLPIAQMLAYKLIRPGGIMSVIGCHCTSNFAFSPVQAYDKNLTYKTGRCPARHYMDRLMPDLVAGKYNQIGEFISHRFAIEDCVEAYDVFSQRKDGCLKAVLKIED
jgi:threonine dehydrogenase-like Zn-dependent dehydrogenase